MFTNKDDFVASSLPETNIQQVTDAVHRNDVNSVITYKKKYGSINLNSVSE